jgi:hypothetical protein
LAGIKDLLTPDEHKWFSDKLSAKNVEKKFLSILKVFKQSQDLKDLASTVKTFYKKAHK